MSYSNTFVPLVTRATIGAVGCRPALPTGLATVGIVRKWRRSRTIGRRWELTVKISHSWPVFRSLLANLGHLPMLLDKPDRYRQRNGQYYQRDDTDELDKARIVSGKLHAIKRFRTISSVGFLLCS